MKKKILSILVALIICLSPVLLLTGCGENNNSDVTFPDTIKTGWVAPVGAKNLSEFTTIPDGEITYTATSSKPVEGYTYNEKTCLYEKEDAKISIADAIEQNLLTAVGLNTSTPTSADGDDKTRTMTLFFGMQGRIEVEYTVVAAQ